VSAGDALSTARPASAVASADGHALTRAPGPPRVAFLTESLVDETAVALLVEGALGRPFRRVQPLLRARGWPNVLQILPAVARHLHFQTNADALVIVVDSDDTVVHAPAHEMSTGAHHSGCRWCLLQAALRRAVKKLPPAHGRAAPLRAVGLAVPAAEAWYLCGREVGVTEAAWLDGQARGVPPYTRRELKAHVYGTERPSLELAVKHAGEAARKHARDLRRLEYDFPGFARLAQDVRAWPV
jgi:hypothetical protein